MARLSCPKTAVCLLPEFLLRCRLWWLCRSAEWPVFMSVRNRNNALRHAAQTHTAVKVTPSPFARLINGLELTYVATHMVPPVVLHCLNILTLGQYSLAGWYAAHQLMMTILSFMSPYIPLTRYQQYTLRLPCNIMIIFIWWKLVGFANLTLTLQSAAIGTVVGLVSSLLWVAGPKLLAVGYQSKRRAWNPYSRHEGRTAHGIVIVRLLNSTTFTSFFEEVYDRGLLYRVFYNICTGWQFSSFAEVPLNVVGVLALAITTICFGAGHTRFAFEPFLGMLFALGMHGLVFRFDSLGPAVLAHAVCNFLLGLWVILAQEWVYW